MRSKLIEFLQKATSSQEDLVSTPEMALAEKNSQEFLEKAQKVVTVTNDEERASAEKLKDDAWDAQKKFLEKINPDIAEARKPYQTLLDKRKAVADPLDQGTRHLAKVILVYDEEKKREAERKKAELLAKIRREEEQRKREEEERAEQIRKENERKAEEEKLRLQSQAIEHKEEGNEAMASLLEDCAQKVEVEPVVAEQVKRQPTDAELELKQVSKQAKAKTGGTKKYTFEITDINAIPRKYLLDGGELYVKQTTAINQIIKAHKGNIEIPGIKIVEDLGARR